MQRSFFHRFLLQLRPVDLKEVPVSRQMLYLLAQEFLFMSFSEIIVTGHKNPDTDAACSAICYADFKNRADPANTYRGVVCGALNVQTRYVFEQSGLPPPEFL